MQECEFGMSKDNGFLGEMWYALSELVGAFTWSEPGTFVSTSSPGRTVATKEELISRANAALHAAKKNDLRETLKWFIGEVEFMPLGLFQMHVVARGKKLLKATQEREKTIKDIEYIDNGLFVTFFPNTKEGEAAWRIIAKEDGSGKVLSQHAMDVIAQLRANGYTVCKSMAKDHEND